MTPSPGGAAPVPRPQRVTAAIAASGLIAILRAPAVQDFEAIAGTLIRCGVRTIEVTLTAAGAVGSLAQLVSEFGAGAIIGARTVLTADQARACAGVGAALVVSPAAAPEIVAATPAAGLAAFPGALTPGEILSAHCDGASGVKLFRPPPSSRGSSPASTDRCREFPLSQPAASRSATSPAGWPPGATAAGLGGPLIGNAGIDGAGEDLAGARQAVAAVTAGRGKR